MVHLNCIRAKKIRIYLNLESFKPHSKTSPAVQVTHLYGIVSVEEHVFGADAAVDAPHGHIDTKGKEVAVVEVSYTVI